ncbi:concanavalin A-like lectin/glucanase domain-containing protein [Sparassis latifolia]|uniref:Probable glycosidase n=1 Tax=Sparassis crispa TaxID=139825 RepID=A0A401GXF3_9APHY|nr:Probable glycosidase [Sparassis crispa]GBE86887.1 Probable glycosidase [Sparassis crispa]
MKSAILAATILSLSRVALGNYTLVQSFSGSNFFNGWQFYGNYDNTTEGDVTYVNQTNATAFNLAYVNPAGNAIIKVDNTSFVPYNEKRNSVRISTTDYFSVGSVFLMDAVHMPYGCSVWPSFWTKGQAWPSGGEIDIVEAVNMMTNNQMALHTNEGCTIASSSLSGSLTENNCNSTAGCTVTENQANSYGASFASSGGGVFATLFETSGVSIWFWSRANVPTSVSSATTSIDVSSWGTPSANYTSTDCNINEFFQPQQIVLDITLCGNWGGIASIYSETCPVQGTANASTCYLDNVINNGTSQYANAYFEIPYLKVFSANGTVITPSGSASGTGSNVGLPTSTSSGSSPSGSSGSKSSSAVRWDPTVLSIGMSFAVAALGAWSVL